VKVAASKVGEEEAARAFGNEAAVAAAAKERAEKIASRQEAKVERRRQSAARSRRRRRVWLKDFLARVEQEQPEWLSVAEVARVWPHPWVTRNGSGKKARIRMQVGEAKYERMQGDDHWHRVDHWTMGPPR
jgi:hypothetical protein